MDSALACLKVSLPPATCCLQRSLSAAVYFQFSASMLQLLRLAFNVDTSCETLLSAGRDGVSFSRFHNGREGNSRPLQNPWFCYSLLVGSPKDQPAFEVHNEILLSEHPLLDIVLPRKFCHSLVISVVNDHWWWRMEVVGTCPLTYGQTEVFAGHGEAVRVIRQRGLYLIMTIMT